MKIQLKRSSVLEDGSAKQPLADQLEYGELAVNYAAADPTIFLKDSSNNIIQIAGANALTQVPTLDAVTDQGNWSADDLLVGGSPSEPNLQLTSTGDVVTVGDVQVNTESAFKITLNGTETYKAIGNGTVALGGTIDSTTDQSQAKIVLNADTGNIRGTSVATSGTVISGGEITGNAGATLTGTVICNNTVNVTENLSVTGVSTLASLNAAYYNLGALAALPE
ncbi:MAG: hypothetical protein CMF11_00015 [Idiomarina sp.]|nr:hypothetical protein [Idiomarina sp.]